MGKKNKEKRTKFGALLFAVVVATCICASLYRQHEILHQFQSLLLPSVATTFDNLNTTNYHQQHYQYPYFSYYQVAKNISSLLQNTAMKHRPSSLSAYSRATVVHHTTLWFSPKRVCQETCCVETVAISLDQDDHKIINFEDGRDLADLLVQESNPRRPSHLDYHGAELTPDILPCLVPGTIIFVELNNYGLRHFWYKLRPHIKVPYSVILTTSDWPTPGQSLRFMMKDPLLIKLYGSNPKYQMIPGVTDQDQPNNATTTNKNANNHNNNNNNNKRPRFVDHKYRSFSIGLSASGKSQEKYLEPYLALNHYRNPFVGDTFQQKYQFTPQSPLDFDQHVFVHFGVHHVPHRQALWKVLCTNHTTTTTTTGSGSCHDDTRRRSVLDIYTDASRYKFGISPPGFGWDCHRTYEFLLLGMIPIIEERHPEGYDLFEGLPVVHMPHMRHATSKHQFVTAISNYLESAAFQNATLLLEEGWKKLFLRYKRRQILHDAHRDKDILVDDKGREYYQAYRYSVLHNDNDNHNAKASTSSTSTDNTGSECPLHLEHCRKIHSQWLEHPTVELSKQEKAWLDAWEQNGQ